MFKLFLLPVLVLSLMVGCVPSNSSDFKEEFIEVADTKAEFIVEGMSCQVGCAAYIDEELEKMDGIISSEVDFETKKASISYDNSLVSEHDIANVINTLKDSSYSVASIEVEILKTIEKKKIDTH